MRVLIVGAGAAGCFCAINLKRAFPQAEVDIYESGRVPLAKVALTGGGRCNITNSFAEINSLKEAYPRGMRVMSRALKVFSHEDTCRWFRNEGVRLVLQDDQCIFPASQDAMQVVRTLTKLIRQNGIGLHTSSGVTAVHPLEKGYLVTLADGSRQEADAVVVTSGGSPKLSGISFLDPLSLEYINPVPSLFTFRIEDDGLNSLTGLVVEKARTAICTQNFEARGPLLITDWGVSGPAVLKLSSYAARYLADNGYHADLLIDWLDCTQQEAVQIIEETAAANPRKQLSTVHPKELPSRLWLLLLQRAGLRPGAIWAETGAKGLARLAATLTADIYHIAGRCHFKDEFVTCGGISLANISLSTLECKKHPGLYFAGEVLDIDAITGGFNLQAAWSTGFLVARSITDRFK